MFQRDEQTDNFERVDEDLKVEGRFKNQLKLPQVPTPFKSVT